MELSKYNQNGIELQLFDKKKDIFLEHLSLDLSNNRLEMDLLDHLMMVISKLTNLKSLELKLTGNIIEI